jgi:peroxiredoxin Q/BCP
VRDEQTRFQEKGVQPLGVNPASVEAHEKYRARFAFNFPLCSDPDRRVAAAYHALKPGSDSIARTVYLIGADGRVLFGQRGMPSADAILAALG